MRQQPIPISENKYHARAVTVDGIRFGSRLEARRYQELKLLEKAGEICNLGVHPKYDLYVNGIRVGHYTADFFYWLQHESVVEDVKSSATRTRDYQLRVKLMKACHGIEVREWPPTDKEIEKRLLRRGKE